MNLAEKIAAAKAALVTKKDQLQALSNKLTALAEGEDMDASDVEAIDELSQQIDKDAAAIVTLEKAEAALARGSAPAGGGGGGGGAPAVIPGGHLNRKPSVDLLVRSAIAAYEAHITHEQVDAIVARRWPQSLEVAETSKLMAHGQIQKAAQNPAFTNVAGWAQELVRESYGAFMDLLQAESVVPRIPMARHEFDGFASINIPARTTGPKNLAGAFRAEGAPIRVGAAQLTSKVLTPKTMAVIGTFTKELLRRSTPNIEAAMRQWMLQDTAVALDETFLDAIAGSVIRPAGIQYGIDPADTAASTGNTANNITQDIRGRLSQLASYNMLSRPVWVMNPARWFGVSMAVTATGDPAFPEAATRNTLGGYPVILSTTVPQDLVFLIDAAFLSFAGGAPSFEGTDVATIHEDDGAPNTDHVTGPTVLPIATGAAGAAVVATPVRSLFQTHSAAVKAIWEVDWAVMRPGAVQVLTGVGW